MFYNDFLHNRATEEALKLSLLPLAALVARLAVVNDALEMGSDIVAEDASEAALFGDGPCGSAARAVEYRELQAEAFVLARAVAIASDIGPKAPRVPDSEIPF